MMMVMHVLHDAAAVGVAAAAAAAVAVGVPAYAFVEGHRCCLYQWHCFCPWYLLGCLYMCECVVEKVVHASYDGAFFIDSIVRHFR